MSCGHGAVSDPPHLPGHPPTVMALLAHGVPLQLLMDLAAPGSVGKYNGSYSRTWFSGQGPAHLSGTGPGADP